MQLLQWPEKPVVKLRAANSVKLVFSYLVKGIKIKITAKFRASRRLRFEDTKRIISPDFRETGPRNTIKNGRDFPPSILGLHMTSTKLNQSATVVTRGYAMYRNSLKLAWMFLYTGFYCSKNNTTIRSPNSRTFVTLELWSTCRSRHPYIFSKSKR